MSDHDERIKTLTERIKATRDPKFDARDAAILTERIALRDTIDGPRVGDFVQFPTRLARITYIWPDGVQTYHDGGSYYLGKGYASYSGTLDPIVRHEWLFLTEETQEGNFWFFHHDDHRAHNGVQCTAPCRVYRCNIDPRDR